MPGDPDVDKFDSANPQNRFTKGSAADRAQFFLHIVTNVVVKPMINIGKASHDGLLEFLELLANSCEEAASQHITDDFEAAFEDIGAKIRGLAAFTSRKHGYLSSRKQDAELLRKHLDSKNDGLYATLTNNPFYAVLVKEYWSTVDACDKMCTQMKVQATRLDSASVRDFSVLSSSLDMAISNKPILRPTQCDALMELVATKLEALAQHVATQCLTDESIANNEQLLKDIFAKAANNNIAIASAATATDQLGQLHERAASQQALVDFETSCTNISGYVNGLPKNATILDLDPSEILKLRQFSMSSESVASDSGAASKALGAVDSLFGIIERRDPTEVDVCVNELVASFQAALSCAQVLTNSVVGSPSLPQSKEILRLCGVLDSIGAVLKYQLPHNNFAAKLQKDPDFSLARAAFGGLQKIRDALDVYPENEKPSWLHKFHSDSANRLVEVGWHAKGVRAVALREAVRVLTPLKTIPGFFDKSKHHFLDESDFMENEDIDMLMAYCNETVFKTRPDEFHRALENMMKSQAACLEITEAFGLTEDVEMSNSAILIQQARTTKVEPIALALILEHRNYPIKLKRMLRDISEKEYRDVWAKTHPIVQNVVGGFLSAGAKALKVE
jgi:hypothetical protein